jgi:transposase
MKQFTFTSGISDKKTLGLDLGDRRSHYCLVDRRGREIDPAVVETTPSSLKAFFKRMKGARLVIEMSTHACWIADLAEAAGLEVLIANPRSFELLTKSYRKTDARDCQLLADAGRMSPRLLSPIVRRPKQCRVDLAALRARNCLVETRTKLVNHVRGVLKHHALRAPSCSPESFHRKVVAVIPKELEMALLPLVQTIEQLNKQIKSLESQTQTMAKERYPITETFEAVAGVGQLISSTFAMTIADPNRFPDARTVGAYVGMVSRQDSSGDSNPELSITKAGDGEVRRLMVIAANYIMGPFGPDCDLKRFGLRMIDNGRRKGKNAKKRAIIAVARKLAVLLLHLWKTGAKYDPFYLARKKGEPIPAGA